MTRHALIERRRLREQIGHYLGSPPLVGSALPVASCSSGAESFPWTSITLWALARSPATAHSRGAGVPTPAHACRSADVQVQLASACSAPWSRCLRHSEISDVY